MQRSLATLSAVRKLVPLTPELAPATIACIADSFHYKAADADPFSSILNLHKHHWEKMASMFVERSAADPRHLSVVALNEDTGRIDGAMINEDWKEPQPTAYKELNSDSWRPVRAVFNELHTRYRASSSLIIRNDILHSLYFTCVHPGARNEGIMKGMWEITLQNAKDYNYNALVAEASRHSVRDIFDNKLGLLEVARVDFDDFKFEGQTVFKELPEENPEFTALSIHCRKVASDLY